MYQQGYLSASHLVQGEFKKMQLFLDTFLMSPRLLPSMFEVWISFSEYSLVSKCLNSTITGSQQFACICVLNCLGYWDMVHAM